MESRRLALALVLAPCLLFFAALLLDQGRGERLLPGLDDPSAVVRLEVVQGEAAVFMVRGGAGWQLTSAANAPGDNAKILAAIDALASLRGSAATTLLPEGGAVLEVRLLDAKGIVLGALAVRPGLARRLPDGPWLAVDRMPALPVWPSAWSTLQPPQIAPGEVAAVARLTPAGPQSLSTAAAAEVAMMLDGLVAADFVAGASINWAGARLARVTLADGATIDLQQVPDGQGRYHLRLTSDQRADVRAARQWAFRVRNQLS